MQHARRPERTSPAANTPGWLVSSKNGGRVVSQCRECATADPVRTMAANQFEAEKIAESPEQPSKAPARHGVSPSRSSGILGASLYWSSDKAALHSRLRTYFEHLEGVPLSWD